MSQAEVVVSTQHGHSRPAERGMGRIEIVQPNRDSQTALRSQGLEVSGHPEGHGFPCMTHPPRSTRGVARETILTLAVALAVAGCKTPRQPRTTDLPLPIVDVDHPAPALDASNAPARALGTDRWTRAYTNDALAPDALRAVLEEAATLSDDSAALTLGRRARIDGLDAVLGSLPPQRLEAFLRGLASRPLGTQVLPPLWRTRWSQDPPSIALAMILGKNDVTLDVETASQATAMLLDGNLDHQIAGARSIQNQNVPTPSVTALLAIHPVAFPLAIRALAQRGATPIPLWLQLIPAIATRVQSNPRSWSGAWLSLMDAVPSTDPTVRQAVLGLEPIVTQVELQPIGVLAAYRCALAIRLDRYDQGQRTEACATGTNAWRSLAGIAERARPPMSPGLMAQQLRSVLLRSNADVRIAEEVARAAVYLPPATASSLIAQLAEARDPGILAALLEGMLEHPAHARAMPSAALDRLLQSPFTLPEVTSLEARIHATALLRTLGRPLAASASQVRALQLAARPDAATPLQDSVVMQRAAGGTWVLETTAGTIRIALRADTAPEALAFIRSSTEDGVYRHTTFHRVVPGFVAQGGDPRGDGYGGTSRIIPTEVSGGRFERGAVRIALAGPDTGGTQFFITLTDSPHLDARYPYIGRVVTGMNVADRLMTGDEIVNAGIVSESEPLEP
ncbi:MAG: peptidylprolyl isomerase [Myxococcaceae bacterium]|nr:peptidylprolyl isomerase [Myxococcaceae bacterium]